MSVFVPTGATVAVDPLDVLLVAPNGSTSTTLYLAQGQPVVVAALPAEVVAELNGAAGLVGPDTLFTTPVAASEWPSPVYIAGVQVKRVQSSGATALGSMVLFALAGFMVTVPAVNLSDMVDLLNACAAPGPAANAANAGTADGSSLTISDQVNISTTALTRFFWAFVPDEGSTTEGTVTLHVYGSAITTAPGAGEFLAVGLADAGLPYSIDDTPFAVMQVTQAGAGAKVTMFGEGDYLQFNVVGVDGSPIVFSGVLVFRTGAS